MNVFFNQFSFSFSQQIVLKALKALNADTCFSVTAPAGELKEDDLKILGTNLVKWNYWDLYFCLYRNVDWNELDPLEPDFLISMSGYESEIMQMMERDLPHFTWFNQSQFDPDFAKNLLAIRENKYYYPSLNYQERKRIYLRHLRYWHHFFKNNKVDVFISEILPHNTHEYMIFAVARHFKVPYVISSYCPIGGHWYFYSDFTKCLPELETAYKKLIQSEKPENLKLSKPFQAEYERLTAPPLEQALPWYMDDELIILDKSSTEKIEQERMLNIMESFCYLQDKLPLKQWIRRFFERDYWAFKLNRAFDIEYQKSTLDNYYDNKCVEPDLQGPYIYFPLHYQPEASSAPAGGQFANQLLIAEMLASNLPDGWKIYVKENPRQPRRWRTIEFYNDLSNVRNLHFVKVKTNAYVLLENCKATVTITGNSGWEALFKSKPVLMFGSYCYQHAPGVFKIQSNKDCADALQKIQRAECGPTADEMKYFLKALEMITIPATPDVYEFKLIGTTAEQNSDLFSTKLVSKIRETLGIS